MRVLTEDETRLLRKILGSVDGGESLLQQMSAVQVADGSTPTFLDLTADDAPRADVFPDGPIPGRFLVTQSGQVVGEVLVWVKSGRLDGLEYAWVTDVAPDRMPDAADVAAAESPQA